MRCHAGRARAPCPKGARSCRAGRTRAARRTGTGDPKMPARCTGDAAAPRRGCRRNGAAFGRSPFPDAGYPTGGRSATRGALRAPAGTGERATGGSWTGGTKKLREGLDPAPLNYDNVYCGKGRGTPKHNPAQGVPHARTYPLGPSRRRCRPPRRGLHRQGRAPAPRLVPARRRRLRAGLDRRAVGDPSK